MVNQSSTLPVFILLDKKWIIKFSINMSNKYQVKIINCKLNPFYKQVKKYGVKYIPNIKSLLIFGGQNNIFVESNAMYRANLPYFLL